ncbi:MAG: aminotransferase class V-fold PLP-dependent enzyme, partial [Candidatus Moranbacteria bacterium]|nr:aminotransferase class V-fold PLP-dependent enzyme [Candidatus Moranbacteria bacterium]
GEHCAAPLHRALSLPATARASFSVYNTEVDIDRLIEGLKEVRGLFENNDSPIPQS